jgi:hypothetical protein
MSFHAAFGICQGEVARCPRGSIVLSRSAMLVSG